jgi:hypothetical protein
LYGDGFATRAVDIDGARRVAARQESAVGSDELDGWWMSERLIDHAVALGQLDHLPVQNYSKAEVHTMRYVVQNLVIQKRIANNL